MLTESSLLVTTLTLHHVRLGMSRVAVVGPQVRHEHLVEHALLTGLNLDHGLHSIHFDQK